ncbi:MAG TPA: class I adenylate-forming enzyme family protein [Solirubrobacteraceae bacterium]|jgi:acyl-CoA synthetase (AMP-forming)/AMP-acid ligase II|nr:class I adenylate-forming enzyme family protein [Solirubrobacteraceae bacterium]
MPQPPQIGALLQAAVSQSPHRPALAHGDTELTYRQLHDAVERLAARVGDRPGERVAVIAPNVPALVVAMFAAWRAGATVVPLSARLRSFELRRVFADARPSAAISTAAHGGFSLAQELHALGEQIPTLKHAVIVDEAGATREELQWPAQESAEPPDPAPAPRDQDTAAIMYTSGTTGEPKGALMSHALGVAEAHSLAELLGDHAGAACVVVVPGSHAFGLACLLCCMAAGGEAVLVDSTTSLQPLAQAVRRHGARVLHGSPALFARVLKATDELPVRSGFTAGSSCPPSVLEELDRREARVLNVYGMTEIGAASGCRPEDPPAVRHHTVGRPLPGYEFRVVDPTSAGDDAGEGDAPGERERDSLRRTPTRGVRGGVRLVDDEAALGEIEVRGPYVTAGYHGRPREQDEAFDGEWFRTGDLGGIDAAGNLTIAGRAKEVVHVGGFNVFPAEVESFLLTHPGIGQASVIGVPHAAMGETLHAFVVPSPEAKLAGRDVVSFARAGIAGYKVPYGVSVLPELPLLASGKPDRRELARSLQAHQAGAQ